MATKLAEKLKALDFAVFEKMGLVGWKERTGEPFAVDVIELRARAGRS